MYGTGKCINYDDLCLNTFFFGGHCVRSPSDLEEAMKYYNMALAINLKTLGPEHSTVANVYYNMGEVYRAQGNLEEALKYYNMSLVINLKTLGVQSTALRNQHVSINHHSVLL